MYFLVPGHQGVQVPFDGRCYLQLGHPACTNILGMLTLSGKNVIGVASRAYVARTVAAIASSSGTVTARLVGCRVHCSSHYVWRLLEAASQYHRMAPKIDQAHETQTGAL